MQNDSVTPAAVEPASEAPVRCSAWLDGNLVSPPKDGTTIVAIGRTIWSDEFSTNVDRFIAAIRWETTRSGYEGWILDMNGLAVARELSDEVKVDWWIHMPSNAPHELPPTKRL